jgi:hypothetical protein
VALGYTCVGVWDSRSQGNFCQLRRTETAGSKHSKPDFPYRSQGVQFCGTATGLGELSQQAAEVWGPGLLHGILEVQCCGTTTGSGEQSLQKAGVLGLSSVL